MDEFCSRKGIKIEFSNARNPQQNGVAERRNRTPIESVRTMLADAKLPVTFWAEAVNTACKFDAKGDKGYFVGYSLSSKAFMEQQEVNGDKEVPESSGNSNPIASTKVSTNDLFELATSSTMETKVPTVNTPVPTVSLSIPLVTSNVPRIIFMGGSVRIKK
nr:hypothetical protein [Tanacetum cinerariifolium]